MNAADTRSVKKAGQQDKLKQKRRLDDLATVLSTRAGRRHVWGQLADAGVFHTSYVAGMPDQTAFNEGRRSLGLKLMADVHALDPAHYLAMATEAREDEARTTSPTPSPEEEETHG